MVNHSCPYDILWCHSLEGATPLPDTSNHLRLFIPWNSILPTVPIDSPKKCVCKSPQCNGDMPRSGRNFAMTPISNITRPHSMVPTCPKAVLFIPYRMGGPPDSVQLPHGYDWILWFVGYNYSIYGYVLIKWVDSMVYGRYIYGIYSPTNITINICWYIYSYVRYIYGDSTATNITGHSPRPKPMLSGAWKIRWAAASWASSPLGTCDWDTHGSTKM